MRQRPQDVFSSCARGKVPHQSWEAAERALLTLVELNSRNGEEHRSRGLTVYRCELCNRWHVGHTRRGARNGARTEARRRAMLIRRRTLSG